jgi:hypothetical protein
MELVLMRAINQFALCAPTMHRARPWRIGLVGHTVEVRAQEDPELSLVDPSGRQMTICCGTAVEFAGLAVRSLGYDCVARLVPNHGPDPSLLATLTLGHRCAPSPAEQRLIDDVSPPDARLRLRSRLSLPTTAVALARAAESAKERGCWLRELNRPGDRLALDRLPGLDAGEETILLLGSHEDSLIGWLRTGRALARILLTLSHCGMTTTILRPITELVATRDWLQRELGLLGRPQIMLQVRDASGNDAGWRDATGDVVPVAAVP